MINDGLTDNSEKKLGSDIQLLPPYFPSSEILFDAILVELENFDSGSTQEQYLQAFCRAFRCTGCLYIRSEEEVFDEQGEQLQAGSTRKLCSTYGFLFRQRVSIQFKPSSAPTNLDSIYVPLDLEGTDDSVGADGVDEVSGILFTGVELPIGVDQSISVVLSSIYAVSDRFTSKASQGETKTSIFDSLGGNSA